jgi:hypothetical protein
MWLLPVSLRAKMAAVMLLGIFFIPFATSDLRGLSHVLTCRDSVATSLYVDGGSDDQGSVLGSADTVTREDVGLGLCGGLLVDLQLTSSRADRALVLVAITNATDHGWQGSVTLDFQGAPVPVSIGSIRPGATATDTVEVRIPEGRSYEINATLLIGP